MFADVILPLPLSDLYTYSIPVDIQDKIDIGHRVMVPFGKKKYYTAIVKNIHDKAPIKFKAKEIHSLFDSYPVVSKLQLKLWDWISFYYLCPLGEVCKAALPSSMKSEDFKQKFTPKTELYLRINTIKEIDEIQIIIGRAKKQQLLFNEISEIIADYSGKAVSRKEATKLKNYSPAVLKGLIDKEIIEQFAIEVGRLNNNIKTTRTPYPLSQNQKQALSDINNCFKIKESCLLHGVTSSGKTEIYIHLIQQQINEGKQVLYLVPEIALTTQLTSRLQAVFGNRLGIYHSKINDNERAEIWQKMQSDTPFDIIIGVRSSVLLPYNKLGLVIVDEEHEAGYKQQDPAPRYNARDTAIVLASYFKAKTLLGSATPSFESYYNTQIGKFGLVELKERYGNILFPSIQIENTYELIKRKKMKTLLSPALHQQMNDTLKNGEQVILFRNRRGFSSLIECKECAWTPKCNNCDVTLTYHKQRNRLICHYCNSSYTIPANCPSCSSESLKPLGRGTEQIEQEIGHIFPEYMVARMDMDTTRNKDAHSQIINSFQENKIQILVGTQMLSKGLDFENVGVVGIISADSLLNYPDFRSHERGFQLIMQAAGRAGRREKQGRVIIQSADPDQPVYHYVLNHDYRGFYESHISERILFRYPPVYRLIKVIIKHKNTKTAEAASSYLANNLRKSLNERVFGPNKAVVSRVQSYYINEIILKLENSFSLKTVRELIINSESSLRKRENFKYVQIYYDVDPL